MEATAPKPGNVHRRADFRDASFIDFLVSAVAIGPIVAEARTIGVGPSILSAVKATQSVTTTNTNLGTILLISPLAAIDGGSGCRDGIAAVLDALSASDTMDVFHAIRLAQPGGLGSADKYDVSNTTPEIDLRTVMRAAAHRDLVARQYDNGYKQVFLAMDWIREARRQTGNWTDAVVHTHIQMMADFPDSLIARKCGEQVAAECSQRAVAVLAAGPVGTPAYRQATRDLDDWLRADQNRRNPGTTADLIAAALFVGLRDGEIKPPLA
jgi:triphosphoribosyl-dephospho-CoA synthase